LLTGANLFATVVRFLLFRLWVFRLQRQPVDTETGSIPFPVPYEMTTRDTLVARMDSTQKASA